MFQSWEIQTWTNVFVTLAFGTPDGLPWLGIADDLVWVDVLLFILDLAAIFHLFSPVTDDSLATGPSVLIAPPFERDVGSNYANFNLHFSRSKIFLVIPAFRNSFSKLSSRVVSKLVLIAVSSIRNCFSSDWTTESVAVLTFRHCHKAFKNTGKILLETGALTRL